MAYVQHSNGYSLRCDKCGDVLHKEHETKAYISTNLVNLTKLAIEYGWTCTSRKITCTYCKTFKR
uniref:Uncharacterized protein n=1 Tax=Geladintestivirus 4 TaxID=3233136 RepID=A0AAU8MJL9_9CAUD